MDHLPLSPAADRAGHVELGRSRRAPRQDEVLQRRELGLELVHEPLQSVHVPLLHDRHGHRGLVLLQDAEVGADVEQLVLDAGQDGGEPGI